MHIEKEKFAESFYEIGKNLVEYTLPEWDELPDIELYMDQVISILSKYLYLFYGQVGDERAVTKTMVNNYVKLGYIPAPVKKKYSRSHLAYLIVICTLKQTLDMATIKKVIPSDIEESEVRTIYSSFVKNQKKAFSYVTENIEAVAIPILSLPGNNQERMNDLLIQVAASANIFKVITDRLTK